jgi:hypothetical protein
MQALADKEHGLFHKRHVPLKNDIYLPLTYLYLLSAINATVFIRTPNAEWNIWVILSVQDPEGGTGPQGYLVRHRIHTYLRYFRYLSYLR